MNNPEQQPAKSHRKQTSVSMALGIGIGLALGAALKNIAVGPAIGILIGDIGSLWQTRKVDGFPGESDGTK